MCILFLETAWMITTINALSAGDLHSVWKKSIKRLENSGDVVVVRGNTCDLYSSALGEFGI